MKMHSRKSCIIIAFLLTFSVAVSAQTGAKSEEGKESLSKQLKSNTVPGFRYAPGTTSSQSKKENNLKTSTVSTQPVKNQSKLASDKKQELKKEETPTVKPVVPTQENAQDRSSKEQ